MGCGLCSETIASLATGFIFLFSFIFSILTQLLAASIVWLKEKMLH